MKLIAIVDSVGRVILGRHDQTGSNKNVTNLKNPAVVNIQVNQESGQISVQLIPYIFREFVSASQRDEGVTWSFQNNNITTSPDLELEESIVDQYSRIFETPTEAAVPVEDGVEDGVVEPVALFDESTDSKKTSK
ncbi:hypothetical protein N9033_00230 [bacterium]|nr:hypothetical protein [bacterium]